MGRSIDRTVTVLEAGTTGPVPRSPSSSGLELIGRAATGTEAITRVLADGPDVLLLDTGIAHTDARAVSRRVREWAPTTRVLALTPADDEQAYTTVVAGAAGAVLDTTDDAALIAALQSTALGGSVLPARVASRLLHDLESWAMRSSDPLHPPPTLTTTEREVLRGIAAGADAATIAASHSVTASLVDLHAGFAVAKLHRYVLGVVRTEAQPAPHSDPGHYS